MFKCLLVHNMKKKKLKLVDVSSNRLTSLRLNLIKFKLISLYVVQKHNNY